MNRSIGGFILYIATALYLLAAGILGFQGEGEIAKMVGVIFNGGFATALVFIFSLAAVVAGILLLLPLFGMEFGIIEIILVAFAVLWILFIIVADFIGGVGEPEFWSWLATLAGHLIVLGAIASGTRMFSGN